MHLTSVKVLGLLFVSKFINHRKTNNSEHLSPVNKETKGNTYILEVWDGLLLLPWSIETDFCEEGWGGHLIDGK